MRLLSNMAGWWARSKYERIGYRGTTKELRAYYKTQIKQSVGKANKNAQFRYDRMIDRLLKHTQLEHLAERSILCLGCRNTHELNALKRAGFGKVVGIDLFSDKKDILVMDMHAMNFPDNSFDVAFSGDSFEHAHTPELVAQEIARVLKPGGYLCLSTPIMWRAALGREAESTKGLADCQDYTSKEQVYSYFSNAACQVIHSEMYKSEGQVNNLLAILKLSA